MSKECTEGKGKWMFSCDKVSYLLSQKRDKEPVGFLGNICLYLHLYMCELCRKYHNFLSLPDKEIQLPFRTMPEEMKDRIRKNLLRKNKYKT